MKAYKGLKRNADGTLECRGFIYEPNKKYILDGDIELCERGFHACHELSDVWVYYPNNGNNVYWEVECGGEIKEHDVDSKFVCSEITLLKEIDTSGIAKFDTAGSFNEGYAWVGLDGKGFNWITHNGEIAFPNQWYNIVEPFSEGYAAVYLFDKGWNFINHNGEIAFPERWYDYVWSFNKGYARVELRGKWYELHKDGVLYNWIPKNIIGLTSVVKLPSQICSSIFVR